MVRGRNRRVDFSFAPRDVQTCIGLVDDHHKTIVCEDGSLNYGFNGDPSVEMNYASSVTGIALRLPRNAFFTYRVKPLFCHRDVFVRRDQEYGESAKEIFVTTTEIYETTTFRWTIFAYGEEGLRADIVRWKLSALPGFGKAPSHVGLSIDGPKDGRIRTIESPGTTAFWTQSGDRHPFMIDLYQFLQEGQTWEGAFAILLEGNLAPESLTLAWADEAEKRMHDYWGSVRPFACVFCIPDRSIAEMLDACGPMLRMASANLLQPVRGG